MKDSAGLSIEEMGFGPGDILASVHHGGVALWSWDPAQDIAWLDALAMDFWGAENAVIPVADLWDRVIEDDRAATRKAWRASAEAAGPYEFRFRIAGRDGCIRSIAARGEGGTAMAPDGRILAIFVDVTAQHQRETMLETMTAELGHRIGNLFAVASAVTRFARQANDDPDALVSDLRSRFADLSAAFRFISRRPAGMDAEVPLAALLERLLRPYAIHDRALSIDVPEDVVLSQEAVVPLSMVVHELATNAVKHGAFSVETGAVIITPAPAEADAMVLTWTERGGPAPVLPAEGFGTGMIDRTVSETLGGAIDRDPSPDGLIVRLTIPGTHLH